MAALRAAKANNEDYVLSTLEHLQALGIRDHWLEGVARLVAPS